MAKKNNIFKEFSTFVQRGNAIDMAVGIIVGSVMTGVVNSLVKDVIMPPIGLLVGGVDFSQWFFVLGGGEAGAVYETIAQAQAAGATTLNLGLFLNSVVSFFITMFAIFLFVRTMNKMRDKKPANTHACPYCKSSINNSAVKCPFCCSDVEPVETGAVEDSDLKKSLKGLKKVAAGVASDSIKKIKKITKH
ncbi:MAG: large conductance mechanosensitive channel protein MscL [Alphaproteobacteria bacterium]|jgi:large conductance mechanosensitive channel|nr:large conductance mechanosensitive channel protein MscL [Alphaproteobacteria bacterium]